MSLHITLCDPAILIASGLEYVITMPNMYARGILFGKMVLELGDTCAAKNERTSMNCDIEFKTKVRFVPCCGRYYTLTIAKQGFFSGTYNCIAGKVKHSGSEVGEVSGRWSHAMEFKAAKTGQKALLFDADSDRGKSIAPKWVAPEEEQEPNESRRLWRDLTSAIQQRDMDKATDAKSAVEDAQREDRKKREEKGEKFVPRFFELKDGRWLPKFKYVYVIPSPLWTQTHISVY